MNNTINEAIFEHAWRYFEKHSDQRVSFFNFYILIMAASSTALGIILQSESLSYFGILLGFFIIITSFIFWKIDQRTSFLIKKSENVLKNIEKNYDEKYHIFNIEEFELKAINHKKNCFLKYRTYGELFRIIYIFSASIGLISIIYFSKII